MERCHPGESRLCRDTPERGESFGQASVVVRVDTWSGKVPGWRDAQNYGHLLRLAICWEATGSWRRKGHLLKFVPPSLDTPVTGSSQSVLSPSEGDSYEPCDTPFPVSLCCTRRGATDCKRCQR